MTLQIAKKRPVFDGENAGVVFEFSNGNRVQVNLDSFSDTMQRRLAVHGIAQKLGDSYANAESFAQAFERFESVLANLRAGTWNPGRMATGGIWVEAIARATNASFDDALAKWDSLTKDGKANVKKLPQVRAAHAAIVAERAQAELDAIGEVDESAEFDLNAI